MENVIRHCNWELNLKLVSFTGFLFSTHSSRPLGTFVTLFSIVRLLEFLSAIMLFHHHFFLSITTIFVFVVPLFVIIDIPDWETDSDTCRAKWTYFCLDPVHTQIHQWNLAQPIANYELQLEYRLNWLSP